MKRPFLVIDRVKMVDNLKKMNSKASSSDSRFIPHLKTHHSRELLPYYEAIGIDKFTVSSIDMAEYFIESGVGNVTIAFPVDISQTERLNKLAARSELSIFVDSFEPVTILAEKIKAPLGIYIEIDNGYKRSGVDADNVDLIIKIIELINKKNYLRFIGLSIHDGLTYSARNVDEIRKIHQVSLQKLTWLKINIQNRFGLECIISMGDSPSMSVLDDFSGIDEIRPGVFIFNDLQQYFLGVCKLNEIAAYMVATVISKYPEREEILLHAGAIHLSKDFAKDSNGRILYGIPALLNEKFEIEHIYPASYIRQLSQEHGVLVAEKTLFSCINIGDSIAILPAHICLACAAAESYYCGGEILSKMR